MPKGRTPPPPGGCSNVPVPLLTGTATSPRAQCRKVTSAFQPRPAKGCLVHLAEGCALLCAGGGEKRGGGVSGLMPYLILFGNSWNQCRVDTAVIHLQRWVVPKDHSCFFFFSSHICMPTSVPSFHLKPQPHTKERIPVYLHHPSPLSLLFLP